MSIEVIDRSMAQPNQLSCRITCLSAQNGDFGSFFFSVAPRQLSRRDFVRWVFFVFRFYSRFRRDPRVFKKASKARRNESEFRLVGASVVAIRCE